MVQVRVDPERVKKRTADSRGRVRVGTEYAGERVEVVVLDVITDNEDEEEGDAER